MGADSFRTPSQAQTPQANVEPGRPAAPRGGGTTAAAALLKAFGVGVRPGHESTLKSSPSSFANPQGTPSGALALWSNGAVQWGQEKVYRWFGVGPKPQVQDENFDLPTIDPQIFLADPTGNGDSRGGQKQVLQQTIRHAQALLRSNAREFNFYFPGSSDYVDNPPTLIARQLSEDARLIKANASETELRTLMPLLKKIYGWVERYAPGQSRIASALNSRSRVATTPNNRVRFLLGERMPDHPAAIPLVEL